jgi:hypothetical protein
MGRESASTAERNRSQSGFHLKRAPTEPAGLAASAAGGARELSRIRIMGGERNSIGLIALVVHCACNNAAAL